MKIALLTLAFPQTSEIQQIAQLALLLSGSGTCPEALRGKPHDMLHVLLTARDLGVSPTSAMRKMYVIDGNVTIAPALKGALVRTKGLGRYWFPRPANAEGVYPDGVPPNDETRATVFGQRTGEDYVMASEFTMADAEIAKVAHKKNWQTYPKRMLQWRALTYLIDDLWPEVGFGIYTPDEMGAITDEDGHLIDVAEVHVPNGYERPTYAPAGSTDKKGDELAPQEERDEIQKRIDALPDGAKAALRERWSAEIRFGNGQVMSVKVLTRRAAGMAKAMLGGIESEVRSGKHDPQVEAVICGACGEEEQTDGSCGCAPDAEVTVEVEADDDLGRPFD